MSENQPQLQSSLGEITSTKTEKDRSWNRGYLAFGQVTKVHPKRYTADVQIYHTNDKMSSSAKEEGRHSCKIGVGSAGFSNLHNRPFGEITPIHAGDIVLVGFLKNSKEQPVIIRVFHSISEDVGDSNLRNILNNYYSLDTEGDIEETLKISPIQDFTLVDKQGNFELASHTKSFIVGKETGIDDESFDFENLSVKTNVSADLVGKTIDSYDTQFDVNNAYSYFDDMIGSIFGGIFNLGKSSSGTKSSSLSDSQQSQLVSKETLHVDEKFSRPKKYMACFRDRFRDNETNWLKVIIDAARTTFRLIKFQQAENKNTMLELDQNGSIKIKRQLDSRHLFDNDIEQTKDNVTQNPSKIFSEVELLADGTVMLQTINKTNVNEKPEEGHMPNPTSVVVIKPQGGDIMVKTTSSIGVSAEKGIDLMSFEGTSIRSKGPISITSTKKIDMAAPEVNITAAVDISGSMDMKGETDIVGNTSITGRTRVNFRNPTVRGDRDTDPDSNFATIGNMIQSISESFIRKQLMRNMNVSLAPTCSVLGMVNAATGCFDNMQWNGKSSTMTFGLFGDLINWNGDNRNLLNNFCTTMGLPSNSIEAQLKFVSDKTNGGLGIDIETVIDGIAGNAAPIVKVVDGLNNLYEKLEKVNNIDGEFQKALTSSIEKLATDIAGGIGIGGVIGGIDRTQFNLSSATQEVIKEAFKTATVMVNPARIPATMSDEPFPPDVVNIGGIIHEGDVFSDGGGGSSDEAGSGRTVIYTIEDALGDIGSFTKGNLISEVLKVERAIDAKEGTNSAQYANTNRKVTQSNSSSSDGDSTSNTIIKGAPITDRNQYIDKLVKRYVYQTAENLLQRTNKSWSYYNLFG